MYHKKIAVASRLGAGIGEGDVGRKPGTDQLIIFRVAFIANHKYSRVVNDCDCRYVAGGGSLRVVKPGLLPYTMAEAYEMLRADSLSADFDDDAPSYPATDADIQTWQPGPSSQADTPAELGRDHEPATACMHAAEGVDRAGPLRTHRTYVLESDSSFTRTSIRVLTPKVAWKRTAIVICLASAVGLIVCRAVLLRKKTVSMDFFFQTSSKIHSGYVYIEDDSNRTKIVQCLHDMIHPGRRGTRRRSSLFRSSRWARIRVPRRGTSHWQFEGVLGISHGEIFENYA